MVGYIQTSFNSGEWSPTLNARTDLAKYKSGAALLENYFVDYRGGASTRAGTRYVLQCLDSDNPVRVIAFQATFNLGYVLEFGESYIRFYVDGAPVLETAKNITGATKANPCVLTIVGSGYSIGDWIFVTGVGGMTQLNGRYFKVTNVVGNAVTIAALNGTAVNSTGYGTYTAGGTASRVYTLASPYAAADLATIKFAQNVNQMILCHPSYAPYALTLIGATNWTLLPIVFGTSAATPTGVVVSTTLANGTWNYSYVVTSVDASGQESIASTATPITLPSATAKQDLRTVAGSNTIQWVPVAGAISYNIYKSEQRAGTAVPAGLLYGFIGSCTDATFIDSNIAPDYSQTPPLARNPFQGSGVASVAVIVAGTYTTVPGVSFTGAASTIAGSAAAVLRVQGTPTVAAGGAGYVVGDLVEFTNGVVLEVATVAAGAVATWQPITSPSSNPGAVTSGATPANPVVQVSTTGVGAGATANLTWGVGLVQVLNGGSGYVATPTVTFSSGGAAATATLSPQSNGNPAVPGFFQQRLVLAGATGSPQTFHMSQPGNYFNFNITSPSLPDNAITGELVSGQLSTIKALVPQPSGLLTLCDKSSWLVNGGTAGSPVSPDSVVANAQSFTGISDVPPINANYDVLFVQSKGSSVRDASYNIYSNVYTGTDISVLSSHLFYGFEVMEWAWAEEPFKIAWAIRDDGTALSLTFLKEQEFIGWAHSVTDGSFKSVAVVTEGTDFGEVDAPYFVVERSINGSTVKYVERMAERIFPNGVVDAWCVDSGIGYDGAPATTFTGGEHLAGETVTGLADGEVIAPFVMPANGTFTLPAASKVVVGIGYTCDLQTLAIDLGDPTIQGKVKQVPYIDVRVCETLGLKIGSSFARMVAMKDLIVGNVSSMLTGQDSQIVTDLVTGDARTYIDATYTVPGQYCIRQDQPLPATILGVIPNITLGDEGKSRERRTV